MNSFQLFSMSIESYFLCKTDTVLGLRLQKVHRFYFGQHLNVFFARHFDAEKFQPKPQTNGGHPDSRFCRYLQIRILRYSHHFEWYRIGFRNEFESALCKILKWCSRGKKQKWERESWNPNRWTDESGSISSFEVLSNKGVQKIRIVVNFEENV